MTWDMFPTSSTRSGTLFWLFQGTCLLFSLLKSSQCLGNQNENLGSLGPTNAQWWCTSKWRFPASHGLVMANPIKSQSKMDDSGLPTFNLGNPQKKGSSGWDPSVGTSQSYCPRTVDFCWNYMCFLFWGLWGYTNQNRVQYCLVEPVQCLLPYKPQHL